MPATVFISYCRRNRPFAERLHLDLKRAGLDVWLDLTDIPPGDDFEQRILPAIAAATHVVLLASPDAVASKWVHREVNEATALGKTVIPLQLAGRVSEYPDDWKRRNVMNVAALDYWDTVRKLARTLGAPHTQLRSLADLLHQRAGTSTDAATELTGAGEVFDATGRPFLKLPLAPSAYGTSWLFAPPGAAMAWPDALGVLFNFTGDATDARAGVTLAHWATQATEPWLVMLEGPVNRAKHKYELRTDHPHEWEDCIADCLRSLNSFVRGRARVGYYLNSLASLSFEIGLQTRMLESPRRVFSFNQQTGRYEFATDGWV